MSCNFKGFFIFMNISTDLKKAPDGAGYIWGYIWSILMAILAISSYYWGIMLLIETSERPTFNLVVGIMLIVAGCVYAADTYGMITKKVWALILTYALLFVYFISGLILLFSRFGSSITGFGLFAWVSIIMIKLIIDLLWFGYFFRRRYWFR